MVLFELKRSDRARVDARRCFGMLTTRNVRKGED